jgi:hypothetical protein
MALGTPCIELCDRASLAASIASAKAIPQILFAIRHTLLLRGKSIAMRIISG